MKKLFVLLAGIAMLTSCTTQEPSAPQDLPAEGEFLLQWMKDFPNLPTGEESLTLYVEKEGEGSYKVAGYSGINRYMTNWIVEGNSITSGIVATTLMAGRNVEIEYQYQALLGDIDQFILREDNLILLRKGEKVLEFNRP